VERWIRRNPGATALVLLLGMGLISTSISLSAVTQQKRAKERALEALRASVGANIHQTWSPRSYVEITSEELAALIGRELNPVSSKHARLKVGVFVHQNPMETVGQYQRLLPYLEAEIERRIQYPVRLDLWLYREVRVGSLVRDKPDFVRINPLFYANAESLGIQLQPLVRQANSKMKGVIFARDDSTLRQLEDLQGRSIIFGEENSIVTLTAQGELAQRGVTCNTLSNCVYLEYSSSSEYKKGGYFSRASEPLKSVMAGKYDAGVALERQVEGKAGVRVLGRFSSSTPFWAGNPEIKSEIANAFIAAMENLTDSLVLRALPEDPQQPNGFARIDASEFSEIVSTQKEAARFGAEELNPGSE
jgi:hypothetical protein